MRVKGMLIVGFLTVMAGTGATTVSESFASDAHRVAVIESLESEGPGIPTPSRGATDRSASFD
jgi:hypothetical protein